ncbi:hypothetical protein GLOIN_2v1563027 [Rhizophagus irregularis DAOM 181602=DAOM 197198]|uniref:Uncharacterized protein n=1 Tax=Rhizophagus irregularis (strain DAOM 181602 / DAOM 197198 / MUCL 43194) TaxID=747089 RepID=A0A2P4QD38_RHIID|nr:hypothetical protein GLOIN_2v1563027 [Rhizophagus irregularis DAOM 181602=DAOM 197198]POG75540.1 hypothetical protein GLOIN_2v1563027 [Rhizophagus irregularis DAOM 181602=DAOM 197198]|eukprot:XP_025182406.1 hypothetical protein GLOIN_2v1563027 [Rhizophagus irregularis DAOM 181602=DAOM 197198]
MFFDLLDNLIPAILNIYTVLFRNNKFDEYVDTIFHLWCMMRRFQRHNYDKILLAFLFDVYYWQSINHPIIKTTAKVSSSKSFRRDALFIDNFQNENLFATSFVPKKRLIIILHPFL